MKKILAGTLLAVLAVVAFMAFKTPDKKSRDGAIGPTGKLDATMQKALNPADFLPMNEPGPHDWLANHEEFGQTFGEYVQDGFVTPDKKRRKIYLLPIGDFPEGKSPSKRDLRVFTEAYFSLPVVLLDPVPVEGRKFTSRKNPYTHNRQILAGDVLNYLRSKLPDDAFCILGITMEDLYPEDDWNFVFGMASLYRRVGVFSFARYDPAFYGENRGKDHQKILLKRSCKVLAHETAHMFGLHHCIFFQCLVNGTNHLQESDSRPLHLCPVCLRKLHHNIGFDVVKRYRNLLDFYKRAGLVPESEWMAARIARLQSTTQSKE